MSHIQQNEAFFFLLLHTCVVQFTQALSAFPEAEKIDHNWETAAEHRWRHYLLLYGLENEEKFKRRSALNLSHLTKQSEILSFIFTFVDITDSIQSLQFDTSGNGQIYKLKALVTCSWCLIHTYSIPPLWLPKPPSFSPVSFVVGKGKE